MRKITWALTGVWVRGLTWLTARGSAPSIDIATATRVQPTMTLKTTWSALSRIPMIIRNRMIGLSVRTIARLLNQGAMGGAPDPAAAASHCWSTVPTMAIASTAIIRVLTRPPPRLMNIWFRRLWAPWISPACSCAYPTHPKLVSATGVIKRVPKRSNARLGVKPFAIANGFTPNRAFDLLGTLLITPVALTSLGWVGYAQEQAGEIQGAQSLRNQMFINLGGGLVSTLMMAVLAFAMVGTVDQQWLAAAAGSGQPPIAPWFSNLAMVLTDNPIILFLMIIGILLNALQVVFNVIVGWTRVAVAMSIDGALPRAVSHVSPRTHTPVNAHVIFLILGGFLYAYIYNMVPGYTTYTLAVTAVATVMYIGTAIGGAGFPPTRREGYQTSPIAKYKSRPVPLITIFGLIAAGLSAWVLYWYITEPFLGIANLSAGFDGVESRLIMVAIFVGWTVYYFVRRAYLRSRGINLDLAYKEVPPI